MKKRYTLLLMFILLMSFAVSSQAASKVYANMNANLRTGPGLKYKIVDTVKDGTAMTYLGKKESDNRGVDWYKVSYEDNELWISSRCASLVAKPTTSAKKRVVTTGEVNLRKGPGMKYKAVVAVQEGSSMKYLGKTRKDNRGVKWYKVSFYGKGLWVSSRYSKRKNSRTSKTVYTRGQVYLRKGPGTDYSAYTSVDEGTALKYLNKTRKDDRGVKWYKVSYNKKSLWVSSRYATLK